MKERNLEIKVGSFVLLGLIAAGVLVVAFGRFGEMFKRSYDIVVPFPNASGIIKNSQVLYRGAKVGSVISPPLIIEHGDAVELILRIHSDVKIPDNAKYRIGSYGLLGDRFVDVIPPKDSSGRYLTNGERVPEMQDQQKSIGDLAEEMQPIVQRLDRISEKVDKQILTDKTAGDISAAVASAKSILARVDHFMADAEGGKGAVYMLMKDQKVAADLRDAIQNFKQLSFNLRKRGVLFYKDLSGEPAKEDDGKKSELTKDRQR
ncbi:MAG: MlaD family protein [Methylacidiphilales bacterium]|nr:MlaD family protein [Candidatus Methylacidiphilales bacterium]